MASTLEPIAARAAAVFTTVVVLPTPPFWFSIAIVLISVIVVRDPYSMFIPDWPVAVAVLFEPT